MNDKSVSYEITFILLQYAKSLGVDAQELYSSVKLELDFLRDKSIRIPADKYYLLWKEVETRAYDVNFGLHFSEATKGSFVGNVLCAVMMNCPNIGEAVQRFIKYYGLLSDLIIPIVELQNNYAYLTWESNIQEIETNRHLTESFLIMLQSILHCLGCQNIIEVRFKHPQPEDISEHRRIFSGNLSFGQDRNEIVIESKDLFLPIALSNDELLQAHEKVAEKVLERLKSKNPWTNKVMELLSKQLLNSINPEIETIARELAVSTRKLQIHLKEEGNTYQKLLDKVREEIAMNYIQEPNVTFYDMAFFLGFSEQSSFNHAFKRWTGTSPNDYRKKMRIHY